jgi:predicted nucleotidyltransferase
MIRPTVNGYLNKLSVIAVLKNKRLAKVNIDRSVASIKTRLKLHYRAEINKQFVFGSYRRKTILPRFMDERSDVDYMVVFSDPNFQPQTYLDRLRRFVEKRYPRTLIKQDHPVIRLDLNHIRFELVPAIRARGSLWIPAKASSYESWIETDPNDFIINLTRKNQEHSNRIKPLVRLVKYWNASSGYPFESFELEKSVVECSYAGDFFTAPPSNLRDYFYRFMGEMDRWWNDAQWKNDVVSRAQQVIKTSNRLESDDEPEAAIMELKKILPAVGVEKV